jgi:hypothetical protein
MKNLQPMKSARFRFSIPFLILLFFLPSYGRKDNCVKFSPLDSMIMDYFSNDDITRNKAIYKNGELALVVGYKKSKQVYYKKYFSGYVVDSAIYYDDGGNVSYKIRHTLTPQRRLLLGKQFNTLEDIRSRFLGSTEDIALKTVELHRYGVKSLELVMKNGNISHLLVYSNNRVKKFTKKEDIDSELRFAYMPNLEEDLTGRPPSEILSFIKSNREMRDFVAKTLSRNHDLTGEILVQFTIKPDGSVPEALILGSTVPCKNVCVDLLNVITNTAFPDDSQKYGWVTVTYPVQF